MAVLHLLLSITTRRGLQDKKACLLEMAGGWWRGPPCRLWLGTGGCSTPLALLLACGSGHPPVVPAPPRRSCRRGWHAAAAAACLPDLAAALLPWPCVCSCAANNEIDRPLIDLLDQNIESATVRVRRAAPAWFLCACRCRRAAC